MGRAVAPYVNEKADEWLIEHSKKSTHNNIKQKVASPQLLGCDACLAGWSTYVVPMLANKQGGLLS